MTTWAMSPPMKNINNKRKGGHTIYGQWTLAAFQTCFAKLAEQFALPADQRQYDQQTQPLPVPAHELALRTNLTPPRR